MNQEKESSDQFKRLLSVFNEAYKQAASGKGQKRHGQGLPYEKQPMQDLARLHGLGFLTGQASKKSQEALRMNEPEHQIKELLGAINYLAGAVIFIQDYNAD